MGRIGGERASRRAGCVACRRGEGVEAKAERGARRVGGGFVRSERDEELSSGRPTHALLARRLSVRRLRRRRRMETRGRVRPRRVQTRRPSGGRDGASPNAPGQARMLRRMARRRGSSGGLARKVGRGGGEAHASKDAGRVQRVARRRRLRRPRVRHLAFAGEGGTRATGFPRRFGLVSGLAPGDIGGGFLAVLRGVDGASGATFREGLGVAKAPARRAHVVRDRGRGRRAPGAAQGSRRRRRRSSPQLEPQDHGSSVRRAPRRRRETSRYGRYGRRDAREMRRGGWMARATREARGVLGAGSSGGARRAVSRCARRRRSATARRVG
mmetsp:Transcript_1363/g.5345  ORF Transcript_1363/g.5345 Transcript_1363/m.5345 type:complete len:327 (+) Transcript_1363:2910-3890(+)